MLAATVLSDSVEDVTVVGGATFGFWIEHRLGIESRATKDEEVSVEAFSMGAVSAIDTDIWTHV